MAISELIGASSKQWPRPNSLYECNANNCNDITLVRIICGSGISAGPVFSGEGVMIVM